MGTKLHKKRKYYKFNSCYNRFEFRFYKRLTRSEKLALKREHLMQLVTDALLDITAQASQYKDDLYKGETPLFSAFGKMPKVEFGGAWVFDINSSTALPIQLEKEGC